MGKPHAALVALAFFLVPSALVAQNLSEAAAKEKERRKAAKGAKSYTEDDLRRAGGGVYNPSPTEEGTAPVEGAPKEGAAAKKESTPEKSEEELHAEASAAWRKRLEAAQESVKKLQSDIDKVQLDLNDSSGGFYTARRTTMLGFLEETKKKLADAQQQVATLEDEGRKNAYR